MNEEFGPQFFLLVSGLHVPYLPLTFAEHGASGTGSTGASWFSYASVFSEVAFCHHPSRDPFHILRSASASRCFSRTLVDTESFARISSMSLVPGCGSAWWSLALNISQEATEKKWLVEK